MSRPDPITRPIAASRPGGLFLDVHRPAGPGPHPAILWLHGGALIGGRRTDLTPDLLDRYLRAGLAVVAPDYPVAPEAGRETILAGVADAWAWLNGTEAVGLGLVPTRLAIVGHSAGGYLALQCGPRLAPRPRAIVAFYGYGDVAADWYVMPSPRYLQEPLVSRAAAIAAIAATPPDSPHARDRFAFYLHCRQQGTWVQEVLRLDPVRDEAALDGFCPVRHVPADHPPTLLLHGEDDDDVPVVESVAMAAALSAADIRHELVLLPGRGHGLDEDLADPAVAAAVDRAIAFLAEALR